MGNFYTETKNNLTVFFNNGDYVTINKDHSNTKLIQEELAKKKTNWTKVRNLINVKQGLLQYIGKKLKIVDGVFTYTFKGKTLTLSENNSIVKKILEGCRQGRDEQAYIKFLDNLVQNPLKTAINELYLFMEANELPITDDGCFLAYKRVTKDFKDYHTQTFDNRVGQTVSMPRDEVTFDRNITCSSGLHFCSKSYLSAFGNRSDPIIAIKVNPKDVVSIPCDYNNAKGRCCKYYVQGVLEQEDQSLEETLKVYNTVEEARRNHKPRKIGEQMLIYKAKENKYKLYEFIGGTADSNLKYVKTL